MKDGLLLLNPCFRNLSPKNQVICIKALQIVSGTRAFRENQVFRVILIISESKILQ
jgi:hypothetical protein